jgi:RNA-directed DNA polymerase
VRYADDFVIGFQHRDEAEQCPRELGQRFAKFGLELHAEKTRLIEFGRFAPYRRGRRGEGRPETFDFLGFTHDCSKTRHGRFEVGRRSNAERMRRTLAAVKEALRRRMHRPLGETGRWLGRVTRGWLNDHAVPDNYVRLEQFPDAVKKPWLQSVRRRSQKGRAAWPWTRFARRYLPRPRILHPRPHVRHRARLEAGAV